MSRLLRRLKWQFRVHVDSGLSDIDCCASKARYLYGISATIPIVISFL